MTLHFRCKGCGELDTIEEISLVPRVMRVTPMDEEGLRYDYDEAKDEAFWEAETNLGMGCDNDRCQYWSGNYGNRMGGGPTGEFEYAPSLPTDIADVVEVDE